MMFTEHLPRIGVLGVLALHIGCSSHSGEVSRAIAEPDPSGTQVPVEPGSPLPAVRINEISPESKGMIAGAPAEPWVELVNTEGRPVSLSRAIVEVDGVAYQISERTLKAGETVLLSGLFRADGEAGGFLAGGAAKVSLIDSDGRELDAVALPRMTAGQSFARSPNASGEFVVYDADDVTPGTPNPDRGFVRRITSGTAFSPRDSSPNAIVEFNGRYWVLGGWRHVAGDVWGSSSDVWTSTDAVNWEIVDPAPPFTHYCSFLAWRGRIWVLGPSSFSSTDGQNWRPEVLQAPALNRSAVHHGRLVSIFGATVQASDDGQNWEVLTTSGPWGNREQPNVFVFRDRLWVAGGATNYGTPAMQLHNDVWSSADGVHWELVTPSATWGPRHWSSVVVHDDRMFLLNGWNPALWPEGNGNTSEVWYSDDGKTWLRLLSERRWTARHASFTAVDPTGGVIVAAGYGSGGLPTIYNDVWRVRARLYFPKPDGSLAALSSWGRRLDGSGASPTSFNGPNQVFVLRNRVQFEAPRDWRVSGAGSVIVVGDGSLVHGVTLDVTPADLLSAPFYLADGATLIARPGSVDVRVMGDQSQVVYIGAGASPE